MRKSLRCLHNSCPFSSWLAPGWCLDAPRRSPAVSPNLILPALDLITVSFCTSVCLLVTLNFNAALSFSSPISHPNPSIMNNFACITLPNYRSLCIPQTDPPLYVIMRLPGVCARLAWQAVCGGGRAAIVMRGSTGPSCGGLNYLCVFVQHLILH